MGRKSDFTRWQELVGDHGSQFKDTSDTRCFAEVFRPLKWNVRGNHQETQALTFQHIGCPTSRHQRVPVHDFDPPHRICLIMAALVASAMRDNIRRG